MLASDSDGGLLHDRGNMQASDVGVAVVVRKNYDVAASRMYSRVVGGGYGVLAAIVGAN